jgi:hypothetical protein
MLLEEFRRKGLKREYRFEETEEREGEDSRGGKVSLVSMQGTSE